MACAVGTPIGRRAAMKAAEATRRKRFIIEHSRDKFTCGKQPLFQIWSQMVRNLATFGESAVR
jgi:hypothetical protein